MKVLNNWILKKAKDLNEKSEAEAKERRKKRESEIERRKQKEDHVRKVIYEMLDEEQMKMVMTYNNKYQIFPNDCVILNIYDLIKPSINSWDLGVNAILNCVSDDEKAKPIIVQVNGIEINHSYADEVIDKKLSRRILQDITCV